MTAAQRWLRSRSFHHSVFAAERIAAERSRSISVCVPTRETAATIEPIVRALVDLRERGVVDEVVVVDAGSGDGTPEIAAAAGAEVRQEADLLPELGPVLGKGDAMWRALSALGGEIVCFVDGDSDGFGEHYVRGLVGPLVCVEGVRYVKAFYRRPFRVGDVSLPEGGGRVNELTARPLLNLFYPDLAGVRQPLAGEMAGTRELLERLPFACGYAVEISLLIDVYREAGLDAIAQVDIDVRHNAHQPLAQLGPMAYAVLAAVFDRAARDGRLDDPAPGDFHAFEDGEMVPRGGRQPERPPLATPPAGR